MNIKTNEDLVQKSLIIIYEKYIEMEFEKGILPWAYTVLDNVIKTDYQTEKRRNTILSENIDQVAETFGNKGSLVDEVNHSELTDDIWDALHQLNEKDKQVLELKLKGYSGDEIMNKLSLKRSALDVRVFRAYQKLKKILEKKGVC